MGDGRPEALRARAARDSADDEDLAPGPLAVRAGPAALADLLGAPGARELRGWVRPEPRGLRARLREEWPTGVPLLADAAAMIAAYLAAERERGRIDPGADTDTLALTLIGAGHLLFAGRHGEPPGPGEVRKVVATALSGALRQTPG